ncbi:MAG: hypothetical protein ACRC10_01310 [Thermoguttaceae bacterium]
MPVHHKKKRESNHFSTSVPRAGKRTAVEPQEEGTDLENIFDGDQGDLFEEEDFDDDFDDEFDDDFEELPDDEFDDFDEIGDDELLEDEVEPDFSDDLDEPLDPDGYDDFDDLDADENAFDDESEETPS